MTCLKRQFPGLGVLLAAVFQVLEMAGAPVTQAAVPPPAPYGPVPSERQLNWHDMEVYGMLNFSTITYCDKEWGYGDEPASLFNPTNFDARQIVAAAKAGGLRGLIINAKHHGGFCLWPSAYNDTYSVKNCPWKDGKGDIVGELVKACREQGLAVGIYLSPWDRNSKDYGRPEYVTYYRNQLRELLTHYGPIFQVWLDGANGGDGYYGGARERRNIDRSTYYGWPETFEMIRNLQPGACIFSDAGPDLRWNGNENGISGDPCWATYTPHGSINGKPATPGGTRYGEGNQGHRDGQSWMPAEADFPLEDGWFWHTDAHSKSAAELVDRYFFSVGRNSAMDIGLAPDRSGQICDEDATALKAFGDHIRATFATNLALGATASASNVRGGDTMYVASNATSGTAQVKTYWATDDGIKDADLTIDFGRSVRFSVVSLREPIQFGQRIDAWQLESWQDGKWVEFGKGDGIGAHRLCRGTPTVAEKIRLRISGASACPALSEFGVYLEPPIRNATAASRDYGMDRTNWKIVSASAEGAPADNAIDGDPTTLWHTHTSAGRQPPPQEIVVDMGASHELNGFLYLPRQDGSTIGNVSRYAFYVSDDVKDWGQPAVQGEFGNIKANPVQQKVIFPTPAKGRYFRFVALGSADGDVVAVAELGVIEAWPIHAGIKKTR